MTGNQGRWPEIDQDGGIEAVTLLLQRRITTGALVVTGAEAPVP